MKTVFTMIIAASFAASAVHAEEAKPATGKTVAVAQQNDLPPGGLNPAIPFAIVGAGALAAVIAAVALDDDDDNSSTTTTGSDD